MDQHEPVIERTKNWIKEVVIGCNFCPFASRPFSKGSIHYQVESSTRPDLILQALLKECRRLDADVAISTTLLILPNAVSRFADFLALVARAEKTMRQKGYDGRYQVATFHPGYVFAGSREDDAANYTNRSIYPMLHLLREAEVDQALAHYSEPEGIPQRNIVFAREKGLEFMKNKKKAAETDSKE